jgi:hypothetical protein
MLTGIAMIDVRGAVDNHDTGFNTFSSYFALEGAMFR